MLQPRSGRCAKQKETSIDVEGDDRNPAVNIAFWGFDALFVPCADRCVAKLGTSQLGPVCDLSPVLRDPHSRTYARSAKRG